MLGVCGIWTSHCQSLKLQQKSLYCYVLICTVTYQFKKWLISYVCQISVINYEISYETYGNPQQKVGFGIIQNPAATLSLISQYWQLAINKTIRVFLLTNSCINSTLFEACVWGIPYRQTDRQTDRQLQLTLPRTMSFIHNLSKWCFITVNTAL